MRLLPVAVVSAILLTACADAGTDRTPAESPDARDGSTPASSATPTRSGGPPARPGEPRVLADGFEVPWGVTFLPGGSALVSERDRHRILRVSPDGEVTRLGTISGVADDTSEGGLMGLAASPTYAEDNLVYAYLTAEDDNRVVRFTAEGGELGDPEPVFTDIPKAAIHDGGRIAFGPDGLLYVTTGDATDEARAQDEDYLGGKVLRMTPEGEPAPGNPDDDSVVYTVGHRNPQGLAWGPGGRLYEAEFGENELDEINLLRPGHNYGWPDVEGTIGPSRPEFTRPLQTWPTDKASPSGLAYAGGSLWLATLQGENVYRMTVSADGEVGKPQKLFDGDWGRLRTVVAAPDGSLWVTTSNKDGRGGLLDGSDRIIRIPLS